MRITVFYRDDFVSSNVSSIAFIAIGEQSNIYVTFYEQKKEADKTYSTYSYEADLETYTFIQNEIDSPAGSVGKAINTYLKPRNVTYKKIVDKSYCDNLDLDMIIALMDIKA